MAVSPSGSRGFRELNRSRASSQQLTTTSSQQQASPAFPGALAITPVSEQPNPFAVPKDEDVFLMREKELQQRRKEREQQSKLKIWEKETRRTALSQRLRTTAGLILPKKSATARRSSRDHSSTNQPAAMAATSSAYATGGVSVREKENLTDFIAQKRKMFLVQMSLDTKRQEIKKLEEKARMKEEALKRSEEMLEADAMRFDQFLRDNDEKAHEASKRQEKEVALCKTAREDLAQLTSEVSKVQNKISDIRGQLKTAELYRDFLEDLTPIEHKKKVAANREAKLRRRIRRAELKESISEADYELEHVDEDEEAEQAGAEEQTGDEPKVTRAQKLREQLQAYRDELEPIGDEDTDEDEDKVRREEMYFQQGQPQKLTDIFAHLEERNLFLIENVQETEAALDELKQKYENTKADMGRKTLGLQENINDLDARISLEQTKKNRLLERAETNADVSLQKEELKDLEAKVKQVFHDCVPRATEGKEAIDMLREIELHLEKLLGDLKRMDATKRATLEKEKEETRRKQAREEKGRQKTLENDLRMQRSLERAKQQAHRHPGKIVMFRSPPNRKKKTDKKKQNQIKTQEEEEAIFFT